MAKTQTMKVYLLVEVDDPHIGEMWELQRVMGCYTTPGKAYYARDKYLKDTGLIPESLAHYKKRMQVWKHTLN